MNDLKSTLHSALLLLLVGALVGCWGHVWPHRRLTVNLERAKSTQTGVTHFTADFLTSHKFVYAGKGGYDAIRNTSTVLDFSGPNGLVASIGSDREGGVLVSLDQDQPAFTSEAQQIFDEMASMLETKWPGAVVRHPIQK